jgi:hypothetical protein
MIIHLQAVSFSADTHRYAYRQSNVKLRGFSPPANYTDISDSVYQCLYPYVHAVAHWSTFVIYFTTVSIFRLYKIEWQND